MLSQNHGGIAAGSHAARSQARPKGQAWASSLYRLTGEDNSLSFAQSVQEFPSKPSAKQLGH